VRWKDICLREFLIEKRALNLQDILAFWMDHGVDGFRCDALKFMFEAEHLRSNPVIDGTEVNVMQKCSL